MGNEVFFTRGERTYRVLKTDEDGWIKTNCPGHYGRWLPPDTLKNYRYGTSFTKPVRKTSKTKAQKLRGMARQLLAYADILESQEKN